MNRPLVLLVDDEMEWVELAKEVLSSKGIQLVDVQNLRDAQSFVDAEPVDFLLLNFELLAGWEELHPTLNNERMGKVMILSNVHSLSLALEAFRRGVDYEDKPFGKDGLKELADRLLVYDAGSPRGVLPDPLETPIGVLIVEDRPEWQKVLSGALAGMPEMQITLVSNYSDAMSALNTRKFHIVVSDSRLLDEDSSNIDGFVLLKTIHESGSDVAVIMTTGFATVELAREAMLKYGAFDFFPKTPASGQFELVRFRESVRTAGRRIRNPRRHL